VLVVEDEAQVRATVKRVLRGGGYTVLEAADGAEALRVLGLHPGAVDLVLTDVILPELNGGTLADALAAYVPGTPVVMMSGFDASHIASRGVRTPSAPLLEKPFTPDRLLAVVRAALEPAGV
jgi:CheY-like chemotaxis protein